ncbi:hypothetical protein F1880_007990 [Penicillium rolfsii]|nr:hypothetical protein F1880_007990 [Penicillium rolfsii]
MRWADDRQGKASAHDHIDSGVNAKKPKALAHLQRASNQQPVSAPPQPLAKRSNRTKREATAQLLWKMERPS